MTEEQQYGHVTLCVWGTDDTLCVLDVFSSKKGLIFSASGLVCWYTLLVAGHKSLISLKTLMVRIHHQLLFERRRRFKGGVAKETITCHLPSLLTSEPISTNIFSIMLVQVQFISMQ